MGKFSLVDQDEIQKTQPKMVEQKLVSLAAVVTLLLKLIRILLEWKYIQDKKYSILAAMLRK